MRLACNQSQREFATPGIRNTGKRRRHLLPCRAREKLVAPAGENRRRGGGDGAGRTRPRRARERPPRSRLSGENDCYVASMRACEENQLNLHIGAGETSGRWADAQTAWQIDRCLSVLCCRDHAIRGRAMVSQMARENRLVYGLSTTPHGSILAGAAWNMLPRMVTDAVMHWPSHPLQRAVTAHGWG